MFRNRIASFQNQILRGFLFVIDSWDGDHDALSCAEIFEGGIGQRGEVIVRRLAESHSYQVSLGLADELEPILRRIIQTEEGIEYVEFVDAAGRITQHK